LPEIKKAYKKLSLVYHPDKAKPGTEKESEERFIDITKAYKV
jgi:translocation protein SEC63